MMDQLVKTCKDCVTKDEMITSLKEIIGMQRQALRLAQEAADDGIKAGRDMQKAFKAFVERFDSPTFASEPPEDGEVK